MKLHRIFAIILRNLYTFRRNYDRLFDAFYWVIMELVVWGLTSSYLIKLSPGFSNVLFIIVAGITFWFLVGRSQYETNVALLEEIWSRNLINIFVSPITFSEWLIGIVCIGIFKALISFVTALAVAYLLFKVGFFLYGFYLIPFVFLLLMTGWWVSFFITGLILRYGTRVQTFAWTLVFLLAPFSAIYYPVSYLPPLTQKISYILPTTYVFQGIREIITKGKLDNNLLVISFALNLFYLIIALIFIRKSFTSLLKRGMLQVR